MKHLSFLIIVPLLLGLLGCSSEPNPQRKAASTSSIEERDSQSANDEDPTAKAYTKKSKKKKKVNRRN